ncbi:MAG: hypothetical protein D6819_05535 [Gammaproteobacteria bacterium]|nr:MAG: hypothetical protein D6819_05535 [Gammaproteobacteria bacterium]
MRKSYMLVLGACFLSASALAEGRGWVFFPAFKEGWNPHFTFAATAGYMDPDSSLGDADTTWGLQLSLDCPWFMPPKGAIRQVFNYNAYEDGKLTLQTIEMNPRYFMTITPGLILGIGPGIGYVIADADVGRDANMWALQVGADLEYRYEHLFLGLSARYQHTQQERVGIDDEGADNWLTLLKAGITF